MNMIVATLYFMKNFHYFDFRNLAINDPKSEIAKLLDFRSNPGLTSRVSELEIGSNNCPSGAFRSDPLETWSDNTKTRVLLELFPKFQGQASEYFDWLYSIPLPTIILKQPC